MTDQTTRPLNLAHIETRANAATEGPWCTDAWEIYQGTEYQPGLSMWIGETCRGTSTPEQDQADAAFVAAARTDVPALIAEVRRLQEQRKYLLDQLAKKDARSGDGDRALLEFLTAHPGEVEMAASMRRDGFGPDEITAMLSKPPAASAAGESGSTR